MGTHLMVGIAYRIKMSKEARYGEPATRKELEASIGKRINIKKFIYSETESAHNWEIKDKALENIVPFLRSQLALYNEKEPPSEEILDKIASLNGRQLKDYLEHLDTPLDLTESTYFHLTSRYPLLEDETVDRGFSGNWVSGSYELIRIFMDGKIIMECYNDMFHYFEQLIALQKAKYPIADCVRVMITS